MNTSIKETLLEFASALNNRIEKIDQEFARAVDMIIACSGKTVVCGMGKSGIIGKKFPLNFPQVEHQAFSYTQQKHCMVILGCYQKVTCLY